MSYDLHLRDIFFTLPILRNEMDPALFDEYGDFDVSPFYKILPVGHPDRIEIDRDRNEVKISWEWSIPSEQKFSEWFDVVKSYLSERGLDLGPEVIDYTIHENYMSHDEYWFYNWLVKKGEIEKVHAYVYDGRHITFDGESVNPSPEGIAYVEDLKQRYQNLSREDTIKFYRYMADWYEEWLNKDVIRNGPYYQNTVNAWQPKIDDWRDQAKVLEELL